VQGDGRRVATAAAAVRRAVSAGALAVCWGSVSGSSTPCRVCCWKISWIAAVSSPLRAGSFAGC